MKSYFSRWYLNVVVKDKPKGLETVFLFMLSIFSVLFSLILHLRFFLYETKIFKSKTLSVPVISVGNISLGGTGKTPLVEALAIQFLKQGKKVGILSRGYSRKNGTGSTERVEFDPDRSFQEQACQWGDEPVLLAKHLPEVPVYVGKNRYQSGLKLISENQVDLILLDDGFQHLKLKRDVDIVILNPDTDLNGKLLPRGLLREPISKLKRADILVCKKEAVSKNFESKLKKWNVKAPVIKIQIKPHSFVSVSDGQKLELDQLKDKPVLLFSGIGQPESFEQLCRKLGLRPKVIRRFPDHHYYSQTDRLKLEELARAHQLSIMVTTEKDAVRLRGKKEDNVQLYFLKISLEIFDIESLSFLSIL